MEKINKLKNQKEGSKKIPEIGIIELDNLSFGLDKYRDGFCDSYRKTYRHRYGLKSYDKKVDFSPYGGVDLNEEKGYNLFGVFKDIEKYKNQEYSFEGLRSILKKNIKKYKLPNIKEKEIFSDIPEKIKSLLDSYILEPKKEGEFASLTQDNLTKVFYMILLCSIYEEAQEKQIKYIQQEINFGLDN